MSSLKFLFLAAPLRSSFQLTHKATKVVVQRSGASKTSSRPHRACILKGFPVHSREPKNKFPLST